MTKCNVIWEFIFEDIEAENEEEAKKFVRKEVYLYYKGRFNGDEDVKALPDNVRVEIVEDRYD